MNNAVSSIARRPAAGHGHANHGWLDTGKSFRFAHHCDPQHRGFRSLRVIHQDRIAPGAGFSTHPHRDREIFRDTITSGTAPAEAIPLDLA